MYNYLDFEKPVQDLEGQILELKRLADNGQAVDVTEEISRLEKRSKDALRDIYKALTPWQKAQVARHSDRPHCLDYVRTLFTDFTPLAGDRAFGDDHAIIGGFARFRGEPVALIGQEKGSDTQTRLKHNFGMAKPEGYRKAVRIMELADRFSIPVISLVDTAGLHATEAVMALYVGDDSSAIMFLKGRNVVSHRLFKTGLGVMLEAVRDRHPDWDARTAYRAVCAAYGPGTPAAGDAGDPIREIVQPAFGRLVQQVERSLSAYLVGRDENIKAIFVAGALAGLPPLVAELGSRLGVKSRPLDLTHAYRFADRAAGSWTPEEAGQMALALGAAMSDKSQSPNLVYTYVRREKEARAIRAKQLLLGLGLVAAALMFAGHQLAARANDRMRAELEVCLGSIRRIVPRTDRAAIQAMSDRAARNSAQLKAMARRCLPVAVLNQVAQLTPEDVRLISAAWEPGEAANAGKRAKKKAAAAGVDPEMRLRLEGLVLGEVGLQESKLASYQMRLEDAELFAGVVLMRSEAGTESGEPVLLFELEMQIEELAGPPLAPPKAAAGGLP